MINRIEFTDKRGFSEYSLENSDSGSLRDAVFSSSNSVNCEKDQSLDNLGSCVESAAETSEKHSLIEVTVAALDFMRSSISVRKCIGMRIDVKSGGCRGMTYELEFVDEANPSDIVQQKDGVTLYISSRAVIFIANMIMDYQTTPMGGSIIFENPNARLKCGCGKSFCVDESGNACSSTCCA
jgi:iron-sulfur cluster assembly protein